MSTRAGKWQKLLTANSTSTGFTASYIAPVAAASVPTTGVVDLLQEKATVPDNMQIMLFGAGADNTTFDLRIIGWRLTSDGVTYIPTPIAALSSCTLSATVGATGLALVSTDRLVDTITLATGYNAGVVVDVTSPTGDVPANVLIDHRGFDKIQFDFDMTGATSGNLIYCFMDSFPRAF